MTPTEARALAEEAENAHANGVVVPCVSGKRFFPQFERDDATLDIARALREMADQLEASEARVERTETVLRLERQARQDASDAASAEHAAQLAALREDLAVLLDTEAAIAHAQDSDEEDYLSALAVAVRAKEIPASAAALARVRAEAVREFLAQKPMGIYRMVGNEEDGFELRLAGNKSVSWCMAGIATEQQARAVANALNALTPPAGEEAR